MRNSVANYIQTRDESSKKTDLKDIIVSDGASSAIDLALQCLISNPRDGVMIPIPQYPLYTAALALYGAS